MKRLYEYFYYRVYVFHHMHLQGYRDGSQSTAAANIAFCQVCNMGFIFILLKQLGLKFEIPEMIFVTIFMLPFLNVFYFSEKKLEEVKQKFKKVDEKANSRTDFYIFLYMLATVLIFGVFFFI
jgi:hypothetical protein